MRWRSPALTTAAVVVAAFRWGLSAIFAKGAFESGIPPERMAEARIDAVRAEPAPGGQAGQHQECQHLDEVLVHEQPLGGARIHKANGDRPERSCPSGIPGHEKTTE